MSKKLLSVPIFLGFLFGCASLPLNTDRKYSEALPPDPLTPLGLSTSEQLRAHPNQSGFYPLGSGLEALVARLATAAVARHSVDLQYYIWEDDLTGRLLLREVLLAADRGVRVRALFDDLNIGRHEKMLAVLDSHPNIEIRMANPFASRGWKVFDVFRFSTVNQRMHNKVFIVDNQTSIIGGRNIGNEYFWASEEMNFTDFDVWAIGPVVKDLSIEFDAYWNSAIAYPISSLVRKAPTAQEFTDLRSRLEQAVVEAKDSKYAEALENTPMVQKFKEAPLKIFWGTAQVVVDPPEKFSTPEAEQKKNVSHQLAPTVAETTTEIILISPYFIPGKRGLQFFRDLKARGISTLVLTNSLASSDVASVFSGYKSYRKDLLEIGVQLYELKPHAQTGEKNEKRLGTSFSSSGLHGKVFVFDRRKIFIGSLNLDPRSFTLNSEMGIVVDSPEMGEAISNQILSNLQEDSYQLFLDEKKNLGWRTLENGKEVAFKKEPETTWWKRFKAGVSAIFIPESWL